MKLKKVKIVKETVEVDFSDRKEDGTEKVVKEVHETKPHPDLLQALANLRVHLAVLTEYIPLKAVKSIATPPEDVLEPFTVSGFSIKTGEDEGIVITGRKTLENGKTVTVNTPFTRLNEDGDASYKFMPDLIEKMERAQTEVNAYVDGSKKAEEQQITMNFDDGQPVTHVQVFDPETRDDKTPLFKEIPQGGDPEVWENGKRPALGTKERDVNPATLEGAVRPDGKPLA